MESIFQRKGWAPDPNAAIQGMWLRVAIERPDPDRGWVMALDSAAMRGFSRWPAAHGLPGTDAANAPITNYRDLNDSRCREAMHQVWESGEGRSLGNLPPDLSPEADAWVGRRAIKGWPTDRILISGQSSGLALLQIRGVLEALMERGCPYGMGWATPQPDSGKEHERYPWAQSAHAHVESRRAYGQPRPWDPATARATWALMGYVSLPNAEDAPYAWI